MSFYECLDWRPDTSILMDRGIFVNPISRSLFACFLINRRLKMSTKLKNGQSRYKSKAKVVTIKLKKYECPESPGPHADSKSPHGHTSLT